MNRMVLYRYVPSCTPSALTAGESSKGPAGDPEIVSACKGAFLSLSYAFCHERSLSFNRRILSAQSVSKSVFTVTVMPEMCALIIEQRNFEDQPRSLALFLTEMEERGIRMVPVLEDA